MSTSKQNFDYYNEQTQRLAQDVVDITLQNIKEGFTRDALVADIIPTLQSALFFTRDLARTAAEARFEHISAEFERRLSSLKQELSTIQSTAAAADCTGHARSAGYATDQYAIWEQHRKQLDAYVASLRDQQLELDFNETR